MNQKAPLQSWFYLCPGESYRRRSHHQQWPLTPVVGCYTDGLHSLAKAHVISQEEAALFRHCKTTGNHGWHEEITKTYIPVKL